MISASECSILSTSECSILLFSKLQPLVKIYEEFDIHSHGISSFILSLKTLRVTSMEGKVLVKNPNGASNAWKHFGFWKIGNKVCKDLAVCFHCKQEYKYSGSTSNLNEHLKRHHSEATSVDGKKSLQSEITSMMKQPILKLTPTSKSLYNETVAEFICGDLAPLSAVESKHFRGMLNIISKGSYDCPSRRFFTDTLLPKMMDDCSQQMKEEMDSISGIGLTTDSWTSLATENYVTYTAHYITKAWEMKSRVLSTQCSKERHTAENLAVDMTKTEQKWGLDKLLFPPTYVHDNASNATKAPKVMETPRLGIGCLAHTINLAATSATSVKQVSDLLTKARKVVGTFNRSPLAANILKKKQELLLPNKQHKLIQDCPTRWNSSYDMLDRLHEQSQVRNIIFMFLNAFLCFLN